MIPLKTAVIVGAGMMGSAMSIPLADNGHAVRVVGTPLDRAIISHAIARREHRTMGRMLPDGVQYYYVEALEEALSGADIVIGGVSSFGVHWFAEYVLPHVPVNVPVLSVTKGLEGLSDGSMRPFPQVLARKCPMGHSLNAIGGPCTSYELADRRHSAVVFCGDDLPVLCRLKSILETDYYHISLSTDVVGVECAAALKNAYALGVSLAVGMSEKESGKDAALAYNPQAALFGQSVREMSKLLSLFGGGPENIVYGVGDLFVTVFGGRTRKLGALLGQGLSFAEAAAQLSGVTLESVAIAARTVRAVETLSDRGMADKRDYPLLFHIGRLLSNETGEPIPWASFEAM